MKRLIGDTGYHPDGSNEPVDDESEYNLYTPDSSFHLLVVCEYCERKNWLVRSGSTICYGCGAPL